MHSSSDLASSKIITTAKLLAKMTVMHLLYASAKRKAICLAKSNKTIRLKIGAGNKRGNDGWITLDRSLQCDLTWDLRAGLPFPDNSLQSIYSSHTLEHFAFPDLCILLKRCYAALKPGGFFSICVPNARLYIQAYLGGKTLSRRRKCIPPWAMQHRKHD